MQLHVWQFQRPLVALRLQVTCRLNFRTLPALISIRQMTASSQPELFSQSSQSHVKSLVYVP